MDTNIPTDIKTLLEQLQAEERDAEALVAGLSEELGTAQPEAGSWSVAECLDHLVIGNRLYLRTMQESATRARARGRFRRRPARPGWLGRLFVAQLEPSPKRRSKMKAPRIIQPRESPPLAETYASFMAIQAGVCTFLRANADLDLAGIHFPNPFVRGIFFSLATGLHVIAAHNRRHLLQAWRARRAIEEAGTAQEPGYHHIP